MSKAKKFAGKNFLLMHGTADGKIWLSQFYVGVSENFEYNLCRTNLPNCFPQSGKLGKMLKLSNFSKVHLPG